jgi:hypothetical protein
LGEAAIDLHDGRSSTGPVSPVQFTRVAVTLRAL